MSDQVDPDRIVKTPAQRAAERLIDQHTDALFNDLDRENVTPADLEAIGERDIAEWYENWLADGEPDLTAGKTPKEVAQMAATLKRLVNE